MININQLYIQKKAIYILLIIILLLALCIIIVITGLKRDLNLDKNNNKTSIETISNYASTNNTSTNDSSPFPSQEEYEQKIRDQEREIHYNPVST